MENPISPGHEKRSKTFYDFFPVKLWLVSFKKPCQDLVIKTNQNFRSLFAQKWRQKEAVFGNLFSGHALSWYNRQRKHTRWRRKRLCTRCLCAPDRRPYAPGRINVKEGHSKNKCQSPSIFNWSRFDSAFAQENRTYIFLRISKKKSV